MVLSGEVNKRKHHCKKALAGGGFCAKVSGPPLLKPPSGTEGHEQKKRG